MTGRVIIILCAIVAAALAILAQIDEQARISPLYAGLVPDSFSGNAARERSKIALQLGDAERSIEQARTGVALRPMPAESLSILALSSLGAGELDMARAALGAASQRGWREPISQLASGQSALEQGEYAIVAQRVNAMFATGELREPSLALLAELLTEPGGREAFAQQLAKEGRWQNNILAPASDAVDPSDWARTIALANQNGADLDCARLRNLSDRYRRDGRPDDAAVIVPSNCRRG